MASYWLPFFSFILEWLLTRRLVLVAYLVALCVVAFGAAVVVCGGGRRHGRRLGLGCIVQRVRGLEVLDFFVLMCLWVLVCLFGRGVIIAPFLSFHP